MDDLAAAGYHVVATDMRGYNTSEKPFEVSDFSLDHLVADVIGLADLFNQTQFVVS